MDYFNVWILGCETESGGGYPIYGYDSSKNNWVKVEGKATSIAATTNYLVIEDGQV